MKLTVLGSATPYPRPGNACSGYLVQHGTTTIWVDAGTGTLAELQRHLAGGGLALDALDAIWISHSHADHTADLLTAYYALRFADVTIAAAIPLIGPPGLADRLVAFLGHRSAAVIPEVLDVSEMRGFGELVIGDLHLEWAPMSHGMPAFGLRVTAPSTGAVLAYSGDTGSCEALVELAADADLFLCEAGATSHEPGVAAVHCTAEDAARMATEAGAKRLVLTHVHGDPESAVARAGVAGTSWAAPGTVFEIR